MEDDGKGIIEDHQLKIFEAFHQVDSDMARKQEGTGLGLTLCKKFSQLMGGTLTVESIENKGSSFRLTLPRAPTQFTLNQDSEAVPNGQNACG